MTDNYMVGVYILAGVCTDPRSYYLRSYRVRRRHVHNCAPNAHRTNA
jgi:hypothetical protein